MRGPRQASMHAVVCILCEWPSDGPTLGRGQEALRTSPGSRVRTDSGDPTLHALAGRGWDQRDEPYAPTAQPTAEPVMLRVPLLHPPAHEHFAVLHSLISHKVTAASHPVDRSTHGYQNPF